MRKPLQHAGGLNKFWALTSKGFRGYQRSEQVESIALEALDRSRCSPPIIDLRLFEPLPTNHEAGSSTTSPIGEATKLLVIEAGTMQGYVVVVPPPQNTQGRTENAMLLMEPKHANQ